MKSLRRTPWPVVAVFIFPSLLGFLLFMAIPIAAAFGISLTNFSGGPRFRFPGLINYINAFKSPSFLRYLSITVNFTVWTVLLQLVLGLVFALILDPGRGPVNQFLLSLGFPAPPWLSGEKTALPTIIMVTMWQNFRYYMVLFLGGAPNHQRRPLRSRSHRRRGAGPPFFIRYHPRPFPNYLFFRYTGDDYISGGAKIFVEGVAATGVKG
jgi:ABC-type sugar transport system permease subunit